MRNKIVSEILNNIPFYRALIIDLKIYIYVKYCILKSFFIGKK